MGRRGAGEFALDPLRARAADRDRVVLAVNPHDLAHLILILTRLTGLAGLTDRLA